MPKKGDVNVRIRAKLLMLNKIFQLEVGQNWLKLGLSLNSFVAFLFTLNKTMMNHKPLSIYLHIPFCQYRCSYCDFNTYTTLGDLKDNYAKALCQEIGQIGQTAEHYAATVFFGGGTPSLMTPQHIQDILATVNRQFPIATDAEVTMECNPETVDQAYLAAVRAAGVNRLSFGAQSAVGTELDILGREHSFVTVETAVKAAKAVGFSDYSIDLIYGVPGQTLASWRHSVEAAIALETPHLSLYCLTIEPGTPMHRWLMNGQITAPDEDLAADQYELASDLLAQAGFQHYEISNWCQPGHPSEHNLAYWRNVDYVGLGAGAHGHVAGVRYHVVKQPRTYIKRMASPDESRLFPISDAVAEQESLTIEDQMGETMMMGLRLLQEGVRADRFEAQFGRTLHDVYGETIMQLIDWGLLAWHGNGESLRLTEKGRFVSNQVFHRFL